MQVAAIKKQQQANQAQGYGEGGFTCKGIKQAQDEYQRLMNNKIATLAAMAE